MATVTDVTTPPSSGLAHIDALLAAGPGWNWLLPARETLRYTFALDGARAQDVGSAIAAAPSAFNAAQQAAAVQALQRLSEITGIRFEAVERGADADLHLATADVRGAGVTGLTSTRWSYSYSDDTVVAYEADAWIYLDNAEFAADNGQPVAGSPGYQVLLHELAHALGLKHPFEGGTVLDAGDDHTALTLMSYTPLGGPYDDYRPYDLAALRFLYGGDGLGGALGHGSAGRVLTGTARADTIGGGDGDDRLAGGDGDDVLSGGGGIDRAVFTGARDDFDVRRDGGGAIEVQARAGTAGLDRLHGVERLVFDDRALAFDLDGDAGTTARFLGAVFGPDAVANQLYAGIGLAELAAGRDEASLMGLALEARLGPGYDHAALVTLLYTNVAGVAPGPVELAHWTGTLAAGTYSELSLALMAAALDLNAANIDLVGLAADGLAYLEV